MQTVQPFEQYLAAELEAERCKILPEIARSSDADTASLSQWLVLSMIPSRLERVQIASSLQVSQKPGGSWTLCTFLLKDPEQDVVGNAINSMTKARARSFAHRAFHYLKSPERPQRILYCLARYCEEAGDSRIAEQLVPTLASDLSDAYLARSFNALYKHGLKSEQALKVAMELVESHIDATNMDRKAAVAAITYLFFAGSRQQIERLKAIHERITIPELRRLLNWGFQEIAQLCANFKFNFDTLSAEKFWQRNLDGLEPNYSGYGCFTANDLVLALKQLDKHGKLPTNPQLTEHILNLGCKECTDWLAHHPVFGIAQLSEQHRDTLELWQKHSTLSCPAFVESVLNRKNVTLWHSNSPELLALHLTSEMIHDTSKLQTSWLQLAKDSQWQVSLNILLGILLAIERFTATNPLDEKRYSDTIIAICKEIQQTLSRSKEHRQEIGAQILGCLIGTTLQNESIHKLKTATMTSVGWWDLADSFLSDNSPRDILSLIERFETVARGTEGQKLNDAQILTLTRATVLALLNKSIERTDKTLKSEILKLAKLTELLDPNNNVMALNSEGEDDSAEVDDSEQHTADWSGHSIVDRPLARWGAILQVQLMSSASAPAAQTHDDLGQSQFLVEALRTAPHVEKRWVARSLARLGNDQTVKALLYQGLQHIDSEFVAHTIRELLPSAHPRAQQALIRCVGRNTISDELKLNILEDISIHNPNEILQELRTLEILRLPQHIDDAVRDAVGRVAALIDETENIKPEGDKSNIVRLDGQDIDSTIRNLLPNHEQLNVDSRSALRTAEMILIQSRSWTQGGMDLSPIVNMHCKAVELVLRDTFEPFTDALLRRGQLSRKLDILGYARPIPEKMQIFEDSLATLPVIKTIPYFSKFKLRKMLRGICMYRPGKRFTLDGPKAFALFFLVVSRNVCPFGLEKMLNLGFGTDKDLFEYIKLIHSLQDSRNRAVHEGLTWEAKDEIESMRAQAFKIIELSLKIKRHLMANDVVATSTTGLGLGA